MRNLFLHAVAREPSRPELQVARDLLTRGAEGVEDLLWILVMSAGISIYSVRGEMLPIEKRIAQMTSRRDFLRRSAGLTLATLASGEPRALWGASEKLAPTADAVILLWMGGGMAQTDTFDPKRYTPYAPGVRSADVMSTFPPIPTVVDGIQLSQGLEKIAAVMDKGMVVRSVVPPDLGRLLHSRHQFHWHTGYEPPQSVAVPHLGSIIARTMGSRESRCSRLRGYRPKHRGQPGFRNAEDLPCSRISGKRVGSVHDCRSGDGSRHRGRWHVDGRAPLPPAPRDLPDYDEEQSGAGGRQRLPPGVVAAVGGDSAPPARIAIRKGVRYIA